MIRYRINLGQQSYLSSTLLVFIIVILSNCGDGPNSATTLQSTETASASLKIYWHNEADQHHLEEDRFAAALDCTASAVDHVVCQVYDTSGALLATGGPWSCSVGTGRINGIPPGSDRIFVVLAEDVDGSIRYHGQTSGITIEANKVTEGVIVDASPFIPTLIVPPDGAELDPNGFYFEWERLENTDGYIVQVAEDRDFQSIVVDEFVEGTTYSPSALSPLAIYFWRVFAVDAFENEGTASQIRSFTTSDCTYTISSTGEAFNSEGGSGSFDITSSSDDCEWIASASAPWIEITSGASGSGDGSVSYMVTANNLSSQRTGTITAGGYVYTITQEGLDCTYQISPASDSFTYQGGTGHIDITSNSGDCPWGVASNAGWITISTGASGSGDGRITYTVATNTQSSQRTGTITVEGNTHTITQTGLGCTYQISPAGREFTYEGGIGSFQVTPSAGDCEWSASASTPWIVITSGTSGSGRGTIGYRVSANGGNATRNGNITVAGRVHRITQTSVPPLPECTFTIDPTGRTVAYTEGTYNVTVEASREDCIWNTSGIGWISVSPDRGSGNGTATYTVRENTTESERIGRISIAEQTHTVTQNPPPPQSQDPDIIPVAFQSPSRSAPGAAIGGELFLNVRNNSTVECNSSRGYFFVGFYLSEDNQLDGSDTLLIGGRESVTTPMSPNEIRVVSIYDGMTLPENISDGDYYLLAVVDESNDITEVNEGNNIAANQIYLEASQ
jgi:hypothetical protein